MANNSAKIAKMARFLAYAHILIGSIYFSLGVAEQAMEDTNMRIWRSCRDKIWMKNIAILIGILMWIAGGLSFNGPRHEKSTTQTVMPDVFMAFSITSAVLGGIVVTFTVMTLQSNKDSCTDDAFTALTVVMLALGIIQFIIGVMAAGCCCFMKPCTPCVRQLQIYPSNHSCPSCEFTSSGYVMVRGADGVPILTPVRAGMTFGGQPGVILVPNTGSIDGPPQPGFLRMAVPDCCARVVQSSISDAPEIHRQEFVTSPC